MIFSFFAMVCWIIIDYFFKNEPTIKDKKFYYGWIMGLIYVAIDKYWL